MMDRDILHTSGTGLRTPIRRISPVLLLEHSNDDDVSGGIDREPGSVHSAPVESSRRSRRRGPEGSDGLCRLARA